MMHKLLFFSTLLAALCSSGQTVNENWSRHKIIDIHAHIGRFRGYDLSLDTLRKNIQKHGIALALISNIEAADLRGITPNINETEANAETAKIVKAEPHLFRGLVWVRPNDGSPQAVESFLTLKLPGGSPVFVGMKFHPQMNHFKADDPRVNGYLELCLKYKIPAVFHCGRPGTDSSPERIYALAQRYPNVPIILYHMGAFGPHEPAIETARQALEKQNADLYLEISQADPESVLNAIRTLGSKRVLFGTDACYYGKNHYQRYSKLLEKLEKELSPDELNSVLNSNSFRLFNLPKN